VDADGVQLQVWKQGFHAAGGTVIGTGDTCAAENGLCCAPAAGGVVGAAWALGQRGMSMGMLIKGGRDGVLE